MKKVYRSGRVSSTSVQNSLMVSKGFFQKIGSPLYREKGMDFLFLLLESVRERERERERERDAFLMIFL